MFLDRGLTLAVSEKMEREKLSLFTGYISLFEKQKNYQQAFNYQRKYTELYDRLYNLSKEKLILEYQEQFQAEHAKAENKLLKHEGDISATKNKTKEHPVIYIFGYSCNFHHRYIFVF